MMSALRLLLKGVPGPYLAAGTFALLLSGAAAAVHVYHGNIDRAEQRGEDRIESRAALQGATYRGAIGVLAVQLRDAQLQLATTTKRVDVQLPKTKRALAAVTPAQRDSSPVAVQVALAEADTMMTVLEAFRVQVQTVMTAAAAVHTVDSAGLHAAFVTIGTITLQRDSAITSSNAKVSKTKTASIGGVALAVGYALCRFTPLCAKVTR